MCGGNYTAATRPWPPLPYTLAFMPREKKSSMLWYQSEWENHRIVLNGLCALSYGLGAPKEKEKVEAKWPCP
ncbi:hypothetical protein PO909_022084 [Leuciscus waleckii]